MGGASVSWLSSNPARLTSRCQAMRVLHFSMSRSAGLNRGLSTLLVLPPSSSASRLTASQAGFLHFSQSRDGPEL
jgi:hypothetical protein